MAEIAAASSEQGAGIEQVNKAITQMDEVTQQNAALVEEAAAAAEAMQEQARDLYAAVSVFKLASGKQANVDLPSADEHQALPILGKESMLIRDDDAGDWKEY